MGRQVVAGAGDQDGPFKATGPGDAEHDRACAVSERSAHLGTDRCRHLDRSQDIVDGDRSGDPPPAAPRQTATSSGPAVHHGRVGAREAGPGGRRW